MPDHATYLKAVNNPVRKAMLIAINEVTKITRKDLLTKLQESNVLNNEDMFDYHMNFLIQTECVKKLDNNGSEYEILPAGKVVEKY
jgi:hypothetical protein